LESLLVGLCTSVANRGITKGNALPAIVTLIPVSRPVTLPVVVSAAASGRLHAVLSVTILEHVP
jgi:hypothetical protein